MKKKRFLFTGLMVLLIGTMGMQRFVHAESASTGATIEFYDANAPTTPTPPTTEPTPEPTEDPAVDSSTKPGTLPSTEKGNVASPDKSKLPVTGESNVAGLQLFGAMIVVLFFLANYAGKVRAKKQ